MTTEHKPHIRPKVELWQLVQGEDTSPYQYLVWHVEAFEGLDHLPVDIDIGMCEDCIESGNFKTPEIVV